MLEDIQEKLRSLKKKQDLAVRVEGKRVVDCELRVSGFMVPGKGLCIFSLPLVFLFLGSRRQKNAGSELSPKKVKWSGSVTSSSSLLSDYDSSGSKDTLSPKGIDTLKPKGKS